MQKRTLQFAVLAGLLIFEGTAAAASISTRVRILEAKVATQERTVKQVAQAGEAQQERLEQEMNKVHQLERKVDVLSKKVSEQLDDKEKSKKSAEDKRYAYP